MASGSAPKLSSCLLLALIAASVALAERLPRQTPKDCAKFKDENAKLIQMVLVASEMSYEERKKQPPQRCASFQARMIKVASDDGLLAAGDSLSQYRQIIRMIETRAECLEKASSSAGGGLRSLLSFMRDCANELAASQSPDAAGQAEGLGETIRQLREQLAAKDATLQHMTSEAESARGKMKLCEQQMASLASANRQQSKQLELISAMEKSAEKQRQRIAKLDSELKQVRWERNDFERLAKDNAMQLNQCRSYQSERMFL